MLMAMQTSVSNLLAKLGEKGRQAHEAHKNDEIQYGSPGLPAGIEGGVAQLRRMQFGIFKDGKNKGQLYFIATGVAKQPYHLDGVPVRGGQTQIGPEPLCDTPTATGKRKTFDDHYAWVLNAVRAFGVSPSFEEMEATMAALVQAKPHFKFRTWKGQKQTSGPYANREPRVTHEWNGRCDYSEQVDTMGGVEDNSEVISSSDNGEVLSEETMSVERQNVIEDDGTRNTVVEDEEFNEFETEVVITESVPASSYEGISVDKLVEMAVANDGGAAKKLADLALESGASAEEVGDANSWQEVADMIQSGKKKEASTQVQNDKDSGPEVGEVYLYRPTDKKTNKPSTKSIEVKVLDVDKDKKTASVNGNKVDYTSVPWGRLEKKS